MHIPPPAEIEPQFNEATSDAANPDSPTDESLEIPMAIDTPEPKYNEATEDAAADDESPADE